MKFEAVIEETQRIRVYITVEAEDGREAVKLIRQHQTETEDTLSTKTLKRWKILSMPKSIKGT